MMCNPFVNALYAIAYIAGVVALFYKIGNFGTSIWFVFPFAFLALFVLSATVMVLLFFYRPYLLFAAGKKEEAAAFFVQTTAAFAGMTIVTLIAMLASASRSHVTQPISNLPPPLPTKEPVPLPVR